MLEIRDLMKKGLRRSLVKLARTLGMTLLEIRDLMKKGLRRKEARTKADGILHLEIRDLMKKGLRQKYLPAINMAWFPNTRNPRPDEEGIATLKYL